MCTEVEVEGVYPTSVKLIVEGTLVVRGFVPLEYTLPVAGNVPVDGMVYIKGETDYIGTLPVHGSIPVEGTRRQCRALLTPLRRNSDPPQHAGGGAV